MDDKPLGRKSYGSIPHLPSSRMGPGDHACHAGQARIATEKARDRHDIIIVQEKLDGSNVGVARLNGTILALTRAGYLASTSPYLQHHAFAAWVERNAARFLKVLRDGERLCGEWLHQAHGTRYRLRHEPFVAFDLMIGDQRLPFGDFMMRHSFTTPHLLHLGGAYSVAEALAALGTYGFHGALDPVEGAVWRVERKGVVDFLVKYVRPEKVDGEYLPEISGRDAVLNVIADVGTGYAEM